MRSSLRVVCCCIALSMSGPVFAETCSEPSGGLGVSRVVEIDASTGALYGDMTNLISEDSFLGPKEVVLTFDDGPIPWITKSILDTLDQFCTKATFFSVGQMALAYPQSIKDVMARGHTLGAHTWSHPMNLRQLPFEKAKDQIERGFAAVALAAGQPIAPFFRFPGLNDADRLLGHMQERGIATFTVDVVSNDSYIASAQRLTQRTVQQVEQRSGGIVLFHDIKASTAKALPGILQELQARGYKIVHMKAKAPLVPIASYDEELTARLAKSVATAARHEAAAHQLQPDAPSNGSGLPAAQDTLMLPGTSTPVPVTEVASPARTRAGSATAGAETQRSSAQRRLNRSATTEDPDASQAPAKPLRPKLKVKQVRKSVVDKASDTAGNGPALFPF